MRSNFYLLGTICLISALALSFSASCESTPESAPPSPIEITDQLGRVVTLDKIPERIISLAPSNTEVIFALGLEDKLVGVTDYCDYPPEVETKPSIGGFTTPNIEEVVALAPDLILAASLHEKKIIPQLEQRGLAVLALTPKTLDQVLASIRLIGEVTGKEEAAAALLADMEKRIKAVTDRTSSLSEDEKPVVFYLTWHDPLMTSGQGTLNNELLQQAGGRNIFPEVSGTESVDFEQLVARNPQVMIAGIGMGSGEDLPLQYLKEESRLQDTDAGKNGRIHGIDMDLTGRPGPRVVNGLEQFARCIHPDIFGPPED